LPDSSLAGQEHGRTIPLGDMDAFGDKCIILPEPARMMELKPFASEELL
jgi:hypothetical protein